MKKILLSALLLFLISPIFSQNNVTLLFPDDGEELTDIAVSFKAKITSNGPYLLYVSRNADFTGQVITRTAQTGQGQTEFDFQYFLTYQGKITPNDKFVLDPGTWYWRVSGDGGNTFSGTRRLVVNNLKPLTPPEWEVTPQKPMFHMRLRSDIVDHAPNGDIAGQLAKIIPPELKEYVVLDIGHSFHWLPDERSLYEYSKIFDDLGYKYFFDMGSHSWLGRIASLGEMEKVFRDLNHCVGASTPEIFYRIFHVEAERSMMDGALELCRKYGKKFMMADMNWKFAQWQRFNYEYYEIFQDRQYADYYIPQFKTTDPWGTYTVVSAIQGMKLSGMVKDIGMWADWWCWEKFGPLNTIKLEDFLNGGHNTDNNKLYPYIQNIKQYIYGMTYGSTTFGLEANLQWHWQTSEPNDHYYRYLQPFVKAVIEEQLIPSEAELNKNFSAIVDTEFPSSNVGQTAPLTYVQGNIWGDFLRSTYGISDNIPIYNSSLEAGGVPIIVAAYAEMFPNTDRYPSGIPFLPKPGIQAPVINGNPLEVIKISDLNTQSKVDVRLNPNYPATGNEAYARKIDKSIFVFNTTENHDIVQNYNVDINFGGFESLSGDVALMSYVVGKCRDETGTGNKSLFIQTNAYVRTPATANSNGGRYTLPTYNSVLNFKCSSRPTLESDELSAISQDWNAATNTLRVEVDHTEAGAVNFTLESNQLSIDDHNLSSSLFSVFPNPNSEGTISVKQNGFGDTAELKIYSVQGRLIKSIMLKNETTVLKINELSSGTYLFDIEGKNGIREIRKLVRIK